MDVLDYDDDDFYEYDPSEDDMSYDALEQAQSPPPQLAAAVSVPFYVIRAKVEHSFT